MSLPVCGPATASSSTMVASSKREEGQQEKEAARPRKGRNKELGEVLLGIFAFSWGNVLTPIVWLGTPQPFAFLLVRAPSHPSLHIRQSAGAHITAP